jgi:predicted Fe-Mo cluster-binding NifX family protein
MNHTFTKIALPLQGGHVSGHFGHPEYFALVSVDRDSRQMIEEQYVVPPPHEPGRLPTWLASQAVKVVLAGGIGPHAVDLLQGHGIEVRTGVPPLTVSDAVDLWLDGSLPSGDNTCDHGHSGGQDHGASRCRSAQ